ncbi:MAG: alpha/beta hydrolase [Rhodoglobus sp.]
MPFELNPRIQQLINAGAGPSGSALFDQFRPGDTLALRAILDEGLAQMSGLPAQPAVSATDYHVASSDGHELRIRWSAPKDVVPGSAIVYFHGGGMVAGSVDLYDPLIQMFVEWTGVPFLSVDYRLAPEAPSGAAVTDGIAALKWLLAHSETLGVDRSRIAVMGDSAGGGVAAAVAVQARDRGIVLAKQILIYPMLDDRNTNPDPHMSAAAAMFPYEFNQTAWSAVLGSSSVGAETVPATSAPARNSDFAGLAPAYIEVGEIDIFRDEDVAYAQQLWRAGTPAELHVHSGYPHAFDVLLIGDELGKRHRDEKIRIIRSV